MSRYKEMDDLDYERTERKHRRDVKYKRRRNYDEESEDEQDNGEILPRWKILTVFAIIGVCFAMLFPSLFGPLFSSIFGRKETPQAQQTPHHPFMDRAAGNQPPRPPGPAHRGPPRMPAVETPQSGRGGMMSWMLPIYTIGVMGFLVYTLFKKKRRRRYDDESDYSNESDSENDAGGIGRKKLRSIQKRLHETEEAMAKILEQLEEVAQCAPETLNAEQLRQQYSPEKLRETELNLQELNRLNELRTQQQLELERNGFVGDDEEYVEDPEDLVPDAPGSSNQLDINDQLNNQRPATGREASDNEDEEEPSSMSGRQTVKSKVEDTNEEERVSRSNSEEPTHQESANQLRQRHKQPRPKVNNKIQNKRQQATIEQKEEQNDEDVKNGHEENVPASDIEDNLLGPQESNESSEKEDLAPIVESPKSSPPKEECKKSASSSERNSAEPIFKSSSLEEEQNLASQSTMFENRLFDFGNPAETKQKKNRPKNKVNDYEAPSLLEFDNGVLSEPQRVNENAESLKNQEVSKIPADTNVYTSDAKRPLRRNRNKRPHAEDPNSKLDPIKMDEQRKIVEELHAAGSNKNEVHEEEPVEESPKQTNNKQNNKKSNKKNGRSRRAP